MEQMADEITLRGDVKDKERVKRSEKGSAWVTGERIQSETEVSNWRLGSSAERGAGDTDAPRPADCHSSSSPVFSLKMYLRRSSSAASSSSTDSLSPSQQSNVGVDYAGIVLNCLFCHFFDMIPMLPDSCERVVSHCCPNYTQVVTEVASTDSSSDESCMDLDCGLLSSCHDASDCLELAMEISEICYH